MDPSRFDTFTRSLTTRSRRGALATLLGGMLGLLGLAETAAKKGKGKGKKKKGGNSPPLPPPTDPTGPPPPTCNPGTTEIAGRCAPLCGPACIATCDTCRTTFDNSAAACFENNANCASALPCANHSECATNELCTVTNCPPVGGITNKIRCRPICQLPPP